MFSAGQQIGSYVLINKLGRGGFGEVWLAEKRTQFISKKFAIKLPLDDQIDFEAIKREAALWEQASGHPNVLPIIDADIFNGQIAIVSEYADGGSLTNKLRNEGTPDLKTALEITSGILSGLEYLHGKNIIHRDIKPQNILIQGNTPRLADFGISRIMNAANSSSMIVGTHSYMAPEAFQGKRNRQTDIWSVGVVLYQLLNGNLPFQQEQPSEVMYAILMNDFGPLPPSIPAEVGVIVRKALAKSPEYRYKHAGEMLLDLQAAISNSRHFHSSVKTSIPAEQLYRNTGRQEPETVMNARDFAEKANFPKSPLNQVFESYERGPQPPAVLQAEKYPHPYQGRAPFPQNNSSDMGFAANILAAVAHIPFCFIGLITSIIILVVVKDNKLARFYAFQSLMLHGTLIVGYIASIAVIVAGGAADSPVLSTAGGVLYVVTVLGVIALFLVSIVMGLLGKIFKLPIIGDLADKWSD